MMGMNALRMFIRMDKESEEANVFYSQRSGGPLYRWRYENHLARWNVSRVDASTWNSQELCVAPWYSIPQELKHQLSEHYLE